MTRKKRRRNKSNKQSSKKGKIQYGCQDCAQLFETYEDCQSHLHDVGHAGQPVLFRMIAPRRKMKYRCPDCGKEFSKKGKIFKHLKKTGHFDGFIHFLDVPGSHFLSFLRCDHSFLEEAVTIYEEPIKKEAWSHEKSKKMETHSEPEKTQSSHEPKKQAESPKKWLDSLGANDEVIWKSPTGKCFETYTIMEKNSEKQKFLLHKKGLDTHEWDRFVRFDVAKEQFKKPGSKSSSHSFATKLSSPNKLLSSSCSQPFTKIKSTNENSHHSSPEERMLHADRNSRSVEVAHDSKQKAEVTENETVTSSEREESSKASVEKLTKTIKKLENSQKSEPLKSIRKADKLFSVDAPIQFLSKRNEVALMKKISDELHESRDNQSNLKKTMAQMEKENNRIRSAFEECQTKERALFQQTLDLKSENSRLQEEMLKKEHESKASQIQIQKEISLLEQKVSDLQEQLIASEVRAVAAEVQVMVLKTEKEEIQANAKQIKNQQTKEINALKENYKMALLAVKRQLELSRKEEKSLESRVSFAEESEQKALAKCDRLRQEMKSLESRVSIAEEAEQKASARCARLKNAQMAKADSRLVQKLEEAKRKLSSAHERERDALKQCDTLIKKVRSLQEANDKLRHYHHRGRHSIERESPPRRRFRGRGRGLRRGRARGRGLRPPPRNQVGGEPSCTVLSHVPYVPTPSRSNSRDE